MGCSDTRLALDASHISSTCTTAGAAAAAAAQKKTRAMGPAGHDLIREIVRRITLITTDPRETSFLLQRLSVAVQRSNAASIAGSLPFETPPGDWLASPRSIG